MDRAEIQSDDISDVYAVIERDGTRTEKADTLFGDLWLEGEVSILFADTGLGKSTLAMQIADSAARGRARTDTTCPHAGKWAFDVTTKPQNVLFLDLESTPRQVELRYGRYSFSKRLKHIRIDREKLLAKGPKALDRLIRELTDRYNARVVVIDSLSFLKRRIDSTNEAAEIVLGLRGLARELGLSILLVGRSKGLVRRRSLRIADMHTGAALAGVADSIFAIGRFASDRRVLYIKHLKSRSTALTLTAEHLPVFKICRAKDGMLCFAFREFTCEDAALTVSLGAHQKAAERIREIRRLSENGASTRMIAADLGLSKSAVHRYLEISYAADRTPEIPPPDGTEQNKVSGVDPQQIGPRAADDKHQSEAAKWEVLNFPGVEEYNRLATRINDAFDEHPAATPDGKILATAALYVGQAKKFSRDGYRDHRYAVPASIALTRTEFSDVTWPRVWKLIRTRPR